MNIWKLGLAAILLPAVPAYGQVGPDIERAIIQGDQIDQALQPGLSNVERQDKDAQAIDGEAGIYVLNVNDIFFVGGSAGFGYSSNPLRTVDDAGDSFSFQGAATAGVRTQLGGAVDFGWSATASGIEYFKDFAPSSRNLSSMLNFGMPIDGTPLYVNVAGFGGFNFDNKFANSVSFYGVSTTLGSGFAVTESTIVRPSLGLTRQWSQISENNSTTLGAGLNVLHVISQHVSLGADLRVSRIWFDDFYEDVTFIPRRDWNYGIGVTVNYRVSEDVALSIGGSYEKRDSSFFLSNYDNFDLAVLVNGSIRF